MSTHCVPIKRIRAIEPHLNADTIEFAVIDGYRSIVKKGTLQPGDLVAYIPEGSLLPEWLLKRLGFWDVEQGRGKLNGKQGNIVKTIKLRGELSQGICYPLVKTGLSGTDQWVIEYEQDGKLVYCEIGEGHNVSGLLGVTKYEPPVPVSMAGEVFSVDQRLTLAFDVENWKSYPDILQDGEKVIFTEKLHGTFTAVAILPYKDAQPEAFGERKNILIYSKGLGAKGLVFKNNERNRDNLYIRSTRQLIDNIDEMQRKYLDGVIEPCTILGETYGPGVQDLTYGKEIGFRVFAVVYGYRDYYQFQDWDYIENMLSRIVGFEMVPVLYRGPFSKKIMLQYTNGKTTMPANHLREGIVITPALERWHDAIGRVCLKSVSADYLTRKGGTEFN